MRVTWIRLLPTAWLAACASPAGEIQTEIEPPVIVARAAWGSQPDPIPEQRRQTPVRITIHHAGVVWKPGDDPLRKLPALQAWGKRDKGWPDVPYHYLIAPDGRIFAGRPVAYEGETNTEYDVNGHVLVQLWGDFEVQRVTLAQLRVTVHLVAWVCRELDISPETIAGHRDWSRQTSCPGKDLYRYIARGDLRTWVQRMLRGEPPKVALRAQLPGGPVEFVPSSPARPQATH